MATTEIAARSPYQRTGKPLSADIVVPAALLALIAASLLLPSLYPIQPPIGGSALEADLPVLSRGHVLGTDDTGNDVLSRLLYGGRTSLVIAFSVNVLGLLIGGTLGAISAYARGVADVIIMRVLDILIAFPSLILVLAVAQALEPSKMNIIWALSFFSIPAFARVARAATLRLCTLSFLDAAKLSGTRTIRVLTRHIAPNILPQLASFGLLAIGITINIEGAVSYLGLGVPMPQPTWGNMISQGQNSLAVRPALVLLPSLFLLVTVLSLNLLSEALRTRWVKR